MAREKIEILAVWAEQPSLFSSGLMRWVAVSGGPDDRHIVEDAPAFPLDDSLVEEHHADDDDPWIKPILAEMDATKRTVVEDMLADFVRSLEREGWVQTGQGADWYNLHFEREVSP